MQDEQNSHGDGSSTPAANSESETQLNDTPQRKVSQRKLQANRENAQKSTGPKSARGQRYSSFNALQHGLQAKKVMFSPDGKLLDEGLQRLFDCLHDRYSTGEVADELLIELAVTDYWRLQKGLEYEQKYLTPSGGEFHPQGGMPTLLRYMTANRRAFDKSLQMLRQMQARAQKEANTQEETDTKEEDGAR